MIFPQCVFRIPQLADLSFHTVLLSPAAIKHLCLFSGNQALLFFPKECPCARPSNLEPNQGEGGCSERRNREKKEGIKDSGFPMIAGRRACQELDDYYSPLLVTIVCLSVTRRTGEPVTFWGKPVRFGILLGFIHSSGNITWTVMRKKGFWSISRQKWFLDADLHTEVEWDIGLGGGLCFPSVF